MTQAETTNTTSRRRFLGAAAVAALAGAPAVVEAAAPNDPTFDLILQHRRAAITYEDLVADYCRRERILVDEGIGLYPYTSVALPAGQPIVVYNHERIDTLACLSEPQRRKAHADLDAALNRYTEVMGDAEDAMRVADAAAFEVLGQLLTAPTSIAGVRALVGYLAQEVDPVMLRTNDQIETLLFSIQDALGREVEA
ncbi:twin-arginine translocation signal domain-containing protein [Bradyrhizobium barranii subsp. barranii]|uniref:Twin-arginine translocation signal domain-containing protein n=1 Tax=Bradyrhizobium barranii subsp. barranii TaxID=2823807 RepID=A0A7Z0TRQ9_9BRAD|nr:twin-arginine translocation signal domain-containing protein [Bradyrhizobium barranii]UGX94235.1 twin-arginine translocation signal domain-containing protein [Bradyrhizobium barranii subsp. barranii]